MLWSDRHSSISTTALQQLRRFSAALDELLEHVHVKMILAMKFVAIVIASAVFLG